MAAPRGGNGRVGVRLNVGVPERGSTLERRCTSRPRWPKAGDPVCTGLRDWGDRRPCSRPYQKPRHDVHATQGVAPLRQPGRSGEKGWRSYGDAGPIKPVVEAPDDRMRLVGMGNVIFGRGFLVAGLSRLGIADAEGVRRLRRATDADTVAATGASCSYRSDTWRVTAEAPVRSDGIVEPGLVRGFSGGGTR